MTFSINPIYIRPDRITNPVLKKLNWKYQAPIEVWEYEGTIYGDDDAPMNLHNTFTDFMLNDMKYELMKIDQIKNDLQFFLENIWFFFHQKIWRQSYFHANIMW